jgi:hypothetical protein
MYFLRRARRPYAKFGATLRAIVNQTIALVMHDVLCEAYYFGPKFAWTP